MKKLEIKTYSIQNNGLELEHLEIENFDSSLDKDGKLEHFEFVFKPLTGKCRVVARVVEEDEK